MKRLLLVLGLLVATVAAQPPQRRATNLAALLAYPAFYHLRPVVVVGKLERRGERRAASGRRHRIGPRRVQGLGAGRLAEVRGEFWDLGRMNADDPRLAEFDLKTTFQIDPEGAWPRPDR